MVFTWKCLMGVIRAVVHQDRQWSCQQKTNNRTFLHFIHFFFYNLIFFFFLLLLPILGPFFSQTILKEENVTFSILIYILNIFQDSYFPKINNWSSWEKLLFAELSLLAVYRFHYNNISRYNGNILATYVLDLTAFIYSQELTGYINSIYCHKMYIHHTKIDPQFANSCFGAL